MRLSVRRMRHAIAPRFAMSTLLNIPANLRRERAGSSRRYHEDRRVVPGPFQRGFGEEALNRRAAKRAAGSISINALLAARRLRASSYIFNPAPKPSLAPASDYKR